MRIFTGMGDIRFSSFLWKKVGFSGGEWPALFYYRICMQFVQAAVLWRQNGISEQDLSGGAGFFLNLLKRGLPAKYRVLCRQSSFYGQRTFRNSAPDISVCTG
jgi:hypothetical protein